LKSLVLVSVGVGLGQSGSCLVLFSVSKSVVLV